MPESDCTGDDHNGQETSLESKRVMMRAERTDEIAVDTLGVCEVVQRSHTYFGPKLRIEPAEGSTQYLLYAPSPSSELELSTAGGEPVAEVSAELVGTKQYDICPHCQEPIKGVEHRRRSVVGACSP